LIVQILTKETKVSADKNYDVECRSSGSRPDAVITWWKANKPIIKEIKNVSSLYIACKLCVIKKCVVQRNENKYYSKEGYII